MSPFTKQSPLALEPLDKSLDEGLFSGCIPNWFYFSYGTGANAIAEINIAYDTAFVNNKLKEGVEKLRG